MKFDKKYDHLLVESGKNEKWIKNNYFSTRDTNKPPFSIILPPPNVTGKLHLGHAWDGYIQDSIIRHKKLSGYDVLFVPGMDHAGIATQSKIEQKLHQEGTSKYEIGKTNFMKKAFEWKEEYSLEIKKQWHKLGLALDYSNERFTLDKESNEAVNKIFIELYNKGYIYKELKPINWDIKLKTTISNIEVINKETKSKMYYIKYYFEDKKDYIVVATTRPETIFSDAAIGISPKDIDKKQYLNKKVINPLNGKLLPFIEDSYIKNDFGSGFMKISAHAAIDIEILQKNNIEIIECINDEGILNETALSFSGLKREEAREKIHKYLEENQLIEKVEEIINNVSYSERSNSIIETLLKKQWFLRMEHFSKKIIENINSENKTKIFPIRFEKILLNWMEEARDWNISRQLWWGHQIPAWYKGEQIKVQINSPGEDWVQDEDVLDTWFSSGLAPFSFLGWPKNEELTKRFFPTSLLVTGYDIIFFWVARMYLFSLEFMNDIPFKQLLIHGLIRDENGKKMSKSLGNGIDPMEVIDEFGSDSLRWFLLTNSTPGYDINFNKEKLKQSWSLCNKIWNIARYTETLCDDKIDETLVDKWINNKLFSLKEKIDRAFNKYEFTIIGKEINNFIYNDFSSWYVELSKVNPNKQKFLEILKNFLILIHPFLPFITDELYKKITNEEILESLYPNIEKSGANFDTIEIAIESINSIRIFRNDFNISNKEKVFYCFKDKFKKDEEIYLIINKLANAEMEENNGAIYKNKYSQIFIKIDEERKKEELKRLEKQKKILENEIDRSENILNNEKFMQKASNEKINIEKNKYEEYKNKLEIIIGKIKAL